MTTDSGAPTPQPLTVGELLFDFMAGTSAQCYDKWHFHEKRSKASNKGLDIVAITHEADRPQTTWLIEVKDFRTISKEPKHRNVAGLPETTEKKILDSLEGLRLAQHQATEPAEKAHAKAAMRAKTKRIVLHLEPYGGHEEEKTKLFPVNFAASVLQKLLQSRQLRAIDPKPLVLNMATTPRSEVPWTVRPTAAL